MRRGKLGVIRVGRVEELSPAYERREDLDLSLNLSYVSIGTVWYGTVRYVCVERGRWNMSIISWQQKIFNYPKELATCTVVTNETMMNGQRQRQRQMKEKKSRGDGRTPASHGGHASCCETTNGQRSAALLSPWMVCCVYIYVRACTVCCVVFARRSRGI